MTVRDRAVRALESFHRSVTAAQLAKKMMDDGWDFQGKSAARAVTACVHRRLKAGDRVFYIHRDHTISLRNRVPNRSRK